MAEVFRARDELLGREVAVKVLDERLSRDRSFVERFRREAQAAANLNHPNIVALYDFGSDDDTYYIVMEFIDGQSLADIVRAEGPLMPERAAEIAADIAKALERAHQAGLVHRDIKSSNIMVAEGKAKVTDFGIARAFTGDGDQTMTQTGMVIGTAAYLSPEQAQGNPVDARSDVYSLGVVLYEMLTGRTPFSGETPLAIAYKHVREDPPLPSKVNPALPPALDAIVMKALSKNPDNRFQSAAAMAEDLERFLAGQKVHATPVLAGETMVAPSVSSRTEVLHEAGYPPEPEPRRAGLYVVIALVVLGLFALLAWWLAGNVFAEDVEVPNLVGMTLDDAQNELEDLGLDDEVVRRASPKPINEVVDQDPEAGEVVKEGDTVTLFVSGGARQTTVPDLEGLSLDDAEAELADAKLEVGDITREASDEIEEDHVIRHDPGPREEVDRGSEVDLVLSAGAEPVTVPIVEGQTEEQAVANIEAVGLEADVIREPSDEDEGIVIAQDPAGGTEAEPGDVVTITVSEGPQAQDMPDVTGMDADDAQDLLESDYGLDVTQVEENEEPCAQPPGNVCRQDPEPGTPVEPGDDATLFVQPGDSRLPATFLAFGRVLMA